ncbi:MAG: SDR family oxidoreductase [Christensenellaceae bacterium]
MIKDKVVVITGTTAGFGKAMAEDFAKAGATVVGVARRQDRLQKMEDDLKNAPGSFFGIAADIADPAVPKKVIAEIVERFGRIDVLVNNAAVMLHRPLSAGLIEEYDEMIALNIRAVIALTQAAMPHLIAASESGEKVSDLVMISSIAGYQGDANKSGYCMTKAAMNMFSECVRLENAGKFVRVSIVEPGAADTELSHLVRDEAERDKCLTVRQNMAALQPEDISRLVLFIVQQPRHVSLSEVVIRPTEQR